MNAFNLRDRKLEDVAAKLLRERRIRWCLTVLTLVATALNFSQVRQTLYLQSVPESGSSRSLGLVPNVDDVHGLSQSEWSGQPNFSHLSIEAKQQYNKLGPFLGQEVNLSLGRRYQVRDSGEYIGELNSRNQMHGYGIYVYFSGGIYEGYWRNGTRSGIGRFIDSEGRVYIGEWVKDKREGVGNSNYIDGSMYGGTRVNDKKQGLGCMKSGNETKYSGDQVCGEWFLDQLDGRGAYFYHNGTMYMGNFQAYKKDGQGLIRYPDGTMCSGDWEHDQLSGTGTCFYPNGDVYRGEWVNGLKSGKGTLIHYGLVESGVWTNDVLG